MEDPKNQKKKKNVTQNTRLLVQPTTGKLPLHGTKTRQRTRNHPYALDC